MRRKSTPAKVATNTNCVANEAPEDAGISVASGQSEDVIASLQCHTYQDMPTVSTNKKYRETRIQLVIKQMKRIAADCFMSVVAPNA